MMQEATGEPPVMWGDSILGFGMQHLRYESGRELDWMKMGVANRREALTLYLNLPLDRHADLLARLGKHKAGKGCLYIKRLDDVDVAVLREILERSLQRA